MTNAPIYNQDVLVEILCLTLSLYKNYTKGEIDMIKQVTIFGKKYVWNIGRFICNIAWALLIAAWILGVLYMLRIETIDLMGY